MATKLFLFIMLLTYLCMGENELETPKPCAPCICKLDEGIHLAICNNTVMHMDSTINFTSVISKITKKVQGIQMILFPLPEITETIFDKLELYNLTDFSIIQCGLYKIEEYSFNHTNLQNITSFSLSENDIPELKNYSFYGLTALKYLKLDHNKLTEINSKRIFGSTPLLEEINLSSNELTYISPNVFLDNTKLKQIDLSENKLRSIEYNMISHLKLTYLFVQANEWDCEVMNNAIAKIVQKPFYDNKSICTYPEKFKNVNWTDYIKQVNKDLNISNSIENGHKPEPASASLNAGYKAMIIISVILLLLAPIAFYYIRKYIMKNKTGQYDEANSEPPQEARTNETII